MVHVLYGYCLLYASDLSRRSMHGKMAGLVTVWHGSGPSHSPMHSPSHSLSHCLRNDGLSPRITFGAALTGANRPAEIRPRRRSLAHLPSPRGRVRSPKTRFPAIEFSCGEAVSLRPFPSSNFLLDPHPNRRLPHVRRDRWAIWAGCGPTMRAGAGGQVGKRLFKGSTGRRALPCPLSRSAGFVGGRHP